jgi:hypothetical protein
MIDQLIFDITDATSREDTHQVGAVVQGVRSGNKELINSTQINALEWLNTASILHDDSGAVINAANPLPVDVTGGVNVEVDLSHVDDSVRLGDGTNFLTSTNENGDYALDVHISNTEIAVVQGSDSPWTVDGTVSISGDVNVTQGTDPWVVSATDLDIRDINASQDNIAISDGTDTLGINTDGSINVKRAAFTTIANGATTLASAGIAQDVVASPLSNRGELWLYNNDNRRMFIGGTGVTAANGFPIGTKGYVKLLAGSAVDVEYVSSKASHNLRYLEFGS